MIVCVCMCVKAINIYESIQIKTKKAKQNKTYVHLLQLSQLDRITYFDVDRGNKLKTRWNK